MKGVAKGPGHPNYNYLGCPWYLAVQIFQDSCAKVLRCPSLRFLLPNTLEMDFICGAQRIF